MSKPLSERRQEFDAILRSIDSNVHVYFQPPPSIKMEYPAIVYSRDDLYNSFANDKVYRQDDRYFVTVVDTDPDSIIADKVSKLDRCTFNRQYSSDNLNHISFKIYY